MRTFQIDERKRLVFVFETENFRFSTFGKNREIYQTWSEVKIINVCENKAIFSEI